MSDTMYPTLLDTETGERREANKFTGWFWWAEGNGSCDCNRAIAFGKEDEMEKRFGKFVCTGCTRFIAVDVHGDLEGMSKAQILEDMNSEYPEELVRRYVRTEQDDSGKYFQFTADEEKLREKGNLWRL